MGRFRREHHHEAILKISLPLMYIYKSTIIRTPFFSFWLLLWFACCADASYSTFKSESVTSLANLLLGLVVTRSTTMFNEVPLYCNIPIRTKDLDNNGSVHQRSLLATRLLKFLLHMKSTENHGYFLTVTNIKCIGRGKTQELQLDYIFFPLVFTCRTFTPCVGETMLGVVHQVHEAGAFLRCGPIRVIYLSSQKMADYHNFVPGEKNAFLNDTLSRIEVGVVVRFRVLDVRWVESAYISRREFHVLATLEGDSLGPVSLSGSDELDLL